VLTLILVIIIISIISIIEKLYTADHLVSLSHTFNAETSKKHRKKSLHYTYTDNERIDNRYIKRRYSLNTLLLFVLVAVYQASKLYFEKSLLRVLRRTSFCWIINDQQERKPDRPEVMSGRDPCRRS